MLHLAQHSKSHTGGAKICIHYKAEQINGRGNVPFGANLTFVCSPLSNMVPQSDNKRSPQKQSPRLFMINVAFASITSGWLVECTTINFGNNQ